MLNEGSRSQKLSVWRPWRRDFSIRPRGGSGGRRANFENLPLLRSGQGCFLFPVGLPDICVILYASKIVFVETPSLVCTVPCKSLPTFHGIGFQMVAVVAGDAGSCNMSAGTPVPVAGPFTEWRFTPCRRRPRHASKSRIQSAIKSRISNGSPPSQTLACRPLAIVFTKVLRNCTKAEPRRISYSYGAGPTPSQPAS